MFANTLEVTFGFCIQWLGHIVWGLHLFLTSNIGCLQGTVFSIYICKVKLFSRWCQCWPGCNFDPVTHFNSTQRIVFHKHFYVFLLWIMCLCISLLGSCVHKCLAACDCLLSIWIHPIRLSYVFIANVFNFCEIRQLFLLCLWSVQIIMQKPGGLWLNPHFTFLQFLEWSSNLTRSCGKLGH